jgi:hypothetical protein
MQLSRGEFIVSADGDDLSCPSRTSELVGAWLGSDRQAKFVYSDVYRIDVNGAVLDGVEVAYSGVPQVVLKNGEILKYTRSFDREVFDRFGPLAPTLVTEDLVLPFRALLIGRAARVPKKLVYYREGSSTWRGPRSLGGPRGEIERARHKAGMCRLTAFSQIRADLEKLIAEGGSVQELVPLLRIARAWEIENQVLVTCIDKGMIASCRLLLREPRFSRAALRGWKRYIRLRLRSRRSVIGKDA